MTQVLDRLRCQVDGYFARHPKATVPSLAKQAGVGASTLRRVLQGETKATFETAWAVLSVVCESEGELLNTIQEIFPETARHLAPAVSERAQVHPVNELRDILRTKAGFIVTNLAACRNGITRARARRLAGYDGERAIDALVELGMVEELEGHFHIRAFAHCDIRSMLDQVSVATEVFDPTLVGTPAAGLMLKTASVSDAALATMKDELRRFASRMIEIAEAPENHGENPVFVTAMMNLLDSEIYKGGTR